MNFKNIRRKQSSNSEKNSEFMQTIASMNNLVSNLNEGLSLKYLEFLSYLLSLKDMYRPIEACYVLILTSILISEYSTITIQKESFESIRWKKTLALSQKVSKFLFSKSPKNLKILEKLGCELFAVIRTELKINFSEYSQENLIKISLLSNILSMLNTTPLPLILTGIKNLITFPVNSKSFPCFTNQNAPYLPNYKKKDYTLVLDLDETLVHVKDKKVCIRPGAFEFISNMSLCYEIVLFTASTPEYADYIMSKVDPDNKIKLRLYRQNTFDNGFVRIKNLEDLGRDLSKVIIIDNLKESFCLQPKNGICIKT